MYVRLSREQGVSSSVSCYLRCLLCSQLQSNSAPYVLDEWIMGPECYHVKVFPIDRCVSSGSVLMCWPCCWPHVHDS